MKQKPPLDLCDELGMEPVPVELEEVNVTSKGHGEDLKDDYVMVREKIITAMVRNAEVIDEAVKCVKQEATPRNVETASAALKALTDNASSLLKVHEMMLDLMKSEKKGDEKDDEDAGENKMTANFKNIVRLVEKRNVASV